MAINRETIQFTHGPLSKEDIFEFLDENASSHFIDLRKLVDLDKYSKKLSDRATHFCLYDKGKLIGFSACYFNDQASRVGYISGISLLDGYRGIGLGSSLLQRVIQRGTELKFREVHVSVDRRNVILTAFFEKNGFVKLDTIGGRYLLVYRLVK